VRRDASAQRGACVGPQRATAGDAETALNSPSPAAASACYSAIVHGVAPKLRPMATETEAKPERAGAQRSARSIERPLAHIHHHLGERLPLEDLARVAGLSVWRFATVFRRQVGQAPHRYICTARVRRAQDLLDAGMPTASVASETGFYDQSHLSRHFKTVCGMTPGQYLAQLRGAALVA